MRKNYTNIGAAFFIPVFIFISFFSTPTLFAEVLGPGWFNGKADQVTLEEADAYYGTKATSKVTTLTTPQVTTQAISSLQAVTPSPEITELARGLKNDPKLIYEYVHNNIDYIPYFGSLKGATLTLLEGAGNDFDQASLMIELLRASGFNDVWYAYGDMWIPNYMGQDNYDMEHWIGFGEESLIQQVLSRGGIPSYTFYTTNLRRVIVKAVIDGKDYLFDPAFKVYTDIPGQANLLGISGYDKNALFSAAGGENRYRLYKEY